MANDFTGIQTNVANNIQDTSNEMKTLITQYINNRYRDILKRSNFEVINRTYTFNTVSGTASYTYPTIPSDFRKEVYLYDTTNNQRLSILTLEQLAESTYEYNPQSQDVSRAYNFTDSFNGLSLLNGNFETWTNGTAVAPDNWSLGGIGVTVAQSGIAKIGVYSCAITAGTFSSGALSSTPALNCSLYTGKVVTASCWVKSTVAGQARIFVGDALGTAYSSYHTGGGDWELLTCTLTITGTALYAGCGIAASAVGITNYYDYFTITCDPVRVKTLTLYPTPNGVYNIQMPYIQLLPDLSGTATPAIECEQALEYGATADGYRWKRQFAKASDMEQMYEKAVIQLLWDRESYPNRVTLFNPSPYTRNTIY